jgi:hypothetical protein
MAKAYHHTDYVQSRSGRSFKGEAGQWVEEGSIDWYVPARYQELDRLLGEGLSAKQICAHFNDCTRSAVIGAYTRLRAKGLIVNKFARSASEGGGIPRIGSRSNPNTTKREREQAKSEKAQAKKIMKAAAQHADENKPKHLRNVFVQDPITREFVEIEAKGWVTHPALAEYNKSRLRFSKRLLDCKGCKFPVDDVRPFLFCNAKVSSGPYCATHKAWSSSTVPSRQASPRPFMVTKSKFTS